MREHELMRHPISRGQVLMIATSASQLAQGAPTGAWLSEIAVPYVTFVSSGYDVTIASPKGGRIPVDPVSEKSIQESEAQLVKQFTSDDTATQSMRASVPLDNINNLSNYSALFLAGGHGASIDFPNSHTLQKLLKDALSKGLAVAALCHGNAAFASDDMAKLVSGKRMAVFSDEEEASTGRESEVPFLLERRLRELGANIVSGPPMTEQVAVDGNLLTGQNPASALKLAQETLNAMSSTVPAGSGPLSPTAGHPGTMTAAEAPAALGIAPLLHPPTSTTESDIHMAIEQAGGVTEPGTVDNLGQAAFPNPGTNAGNEAGASA